MVPIVDAVLDSRIMLPIGGSLQVLVVDAKGSPVSGAAISLPGFAVQGHAAEELAALGLLRASDSRFMTGEEGAFALELLPAAKWTVRAYKAGRVAFAPCRIEAGNHAFVRLVLE